MMTNGNQRYKNEVSRVTRRKRPSFCGTIIAITATFFTVYLLQCNPINALSLSSPLMTTTTRLPYLSLQKQHCHHQWCTTTTSSADFLRLPTKPSISVDNLSSMYSSTSLHLYPSFSTTYCNTFQSSCTTSIGSRKYSSLLQSDSKNINEGQYMETRGDGGEWNAILAAFQIYKAVYGDLKIPSRFVVPSMPPWPETAWNVKLGQKVAAIRSTGRFVENNEERRRLLESMGFIWRVRTPKADAIPSTSASSSAAESMEDGISFAQLFTALSTYKQLDSNDVNNIPVNYVIPNCDPWPEETRGMPLGKKVQSILASPLQYLKQNLEAREKFEEIRFHWDAVPSSLSASRSGKKTSKRMESNEKRYQNVYNALKRYKEIHGDLLVPQPFVISSDTSEWDEDLWGLRLGARVNAIRSQGTFIKNNDARREQLNELGFVWDLSQTRSGKKRGRKKKVVTIGTAAEKETKKKKEEDADIADKETVTTETDAPKISPIQEEVSKARLTKGEPKPMDPFEALYKRQQQKEGELTWSSSSSTPFKDDLLELQQQQQEQQQAGESDYKPPRDFMETTKGAAERAMSVGIVESISDTDQVVKGHIQMQGHPWFNDDFGGDFVFDDVIEALNVYKSIYGTFDDMDTGNEEEEGFIIPDASPSSLTDYFTGDDEDSLSAAAAAAAEAAAAIAAAEESGSLDRSEELFAQDIDRLQSEIESSTSLDDISWQSLLEDEDTSVETETDEKEDETATAYWPEYLSGMKLGSIVRRIREGDLEVKHLPERKAKLDDMGFDWGDERRFLEIPFDKSMCALYAYYMIRGDLFVYEDFIMPDEDPWPRALSGFDLGKAVFYLRAKQNFLEEYHPMKKYMLNMLEFVWFPMDALPLDPDLPPLTWEEEHVKYVGHPLARINAPPLAAVESVVHPVDHPDSKDKYDFDYELVKDYYEKELGIKDIGGFLRERGFMQLADEHEAKYGKAVDVYDAEYEEEYLEEEVEDEKEDEEDYDEEFDDEELEELDEEDEMDFVEEGEEEEDEEEEDDLEDDLEIEEEEL